MSEALPERVRYEDVDDIIDAAARAMDAEADYLSVEELREVAADLDVEEKYLAPAVEEVRKRRQARLEAQARKEKLRNRILIGAGVVVALLGIWTFATLGSLNDLHVAVTQARSQVVNVQQRQVATETRWQGKPDSTDKTAELAGAENRVRIERARYDKAAAAYNAAASGFPASLARAIGGLPDEVPMSSKVTQW